MDRPKKRINLIDLLCDILTSLVEKVGKPNNKPISVKIRLLSNKSDTLTLVSRLVGTGISNLTLHCRTREMRNRESPIRDYIEEIFQICKDNNVTFIINGQIKDYQEYKLLQKQYGSDVGCMTASAAEINPTCFNKNGALPWYTTVKEYIKLCDKFDNYKANTKYCITRMIDLPFLNGAIVKVPCLANFETTILPRKPVPPKTET